MAASNKVKALLDELASVLAEMGAMGDEQPPAAEPAGDESQMPENPEKSSYDEGAEEPDEEAEMHKQKKLRCLCERAEKLRDSIKFYEGVAARELEMRSVIDKAAPASPSNAANTQKETRSVSIYHNLPGAGRLKGFKGGNAEERAYRAGMFFRATLAGDQTAAQWCREHGVAGVESRALGENVNSLGGVFVNDEILNEIIVLVEQYGAFPAAARNVNMASDTLIVPRRVGGLQAYFVGENTAIPDSDATWDRVQLVAKKVAVSNRMSSEILEDASVINLGDYLATETARAIAILVDRVGFVGTGAGNDGGIVGAATKLNDGQHSQSLVTAAAGHVSLETLTIDDFIAAAGRVPLFARANAQWYCSPAAYSSAVQRLGLSSNVGTMAGGNTQDNLTQAPELRLLGYKVNFVHTMNNTLGSDPGQIKFILGDMSLSSMYATRRGLQLRTSVDRYAELDQTLLVASTRFDCVTHDCGSNTVAGPIVGLRTALA
jgi:HK97 family phage major capsid protein